MPCCICGKRKGLKDPTCGTPKCKNERDKRVRIGRRAPDPRGLDRLHMLYTAGGQQPSMGHEFNEELVCKSCQTDWQQQQAETLVCQQINVGEVVDYDELFTWNILPELQADQDPNVYVRSRYRKKWHRRVAEVVQAERKRPPRPLEKARLVLTRHSAARPDPDNVPNSFKPLLDGLVKALVLAEDTEDVVGKPNYQWVRAKPLEGKVTIHVVGVEQEIADGADPVPGYEA